MSSETQTISGNQNLNQLIEQGDWAEVITRLKIPLIGLFAIIVTAVIGWGILNNQAKAKRAQMDDLIYKFDRDYLAPLAQKQKSPEEALSAFQNLKKDLKNHQGIYPIALRLSDLLTAQGQRDTVRPLIEESFKEVDSDYVKALAGMRLAALLEDMNDIDGAEATLLKMASAKVKIVEAKIYLDLGRISVQKGDKVKAREHFQYVIDNTEEQEFKRMAGLYLAQIGE